MIIILRRRALFRLFEKNLVGKDTKDAVYNNAFISYYITDYTRGQLIDFRKFFESDERSYKITYLLNYVKNHELEKEHKILFTEWKDKFEDQVNKLIVHLDKDSKKLNKEAQKIDIDSFIDKTNLFIDHILCSIRTKGVVVIDKKFRDLDGDFLNKDQTKEFEEYKNWLCN